MKTFYRLILVSLLISPLGISQPLGAQTIGVSIPAATHGWTGGLNFHAEETKNRLEAANPSLRIVLLTANSASEQANDLEDLIAIHNIDALVVLPFESAPLTGPVQNVKRQGVFITVVDRGLSEPNIQDVYVAGNNAEMGRVSANYMKQRLSAGDNIVILRGIPTVIDDQRFNGFMSELDGSGINILDDQYANWNRDDGFTVMQDFLSRFPDIDAVWAQDDDIAIGVIQAVRQARRQDELFIVGGGGMKDIVRRVMAGDALTPVDVLYPPSMIATAIELTALKFISNVPISGEYILGSPLITPENAEQFYYPDSPF
ncbi:MAG: ABC transporter substrate-binding protein [Pseudomonadota bacterium]|nr:ABC transporter substrate-binding protein [Pseudomonadales bacterium]MEC7767577.1 ABC transporter substrate-binding protein [Pseudomonadota bacterium]MEC9300611.1 ABC transporter substrate-binding protein [Pseudomonadota bacterium]MED5529889.1 ABC transporter substrate-binding protein [Pseudomonadota bacterium]|tara:strand:+ start:2569 stop:3516 length:948 start_codon:yes stop_codon:yes gene_type:complete